MFNLQHSINILKGVLFVTVFATVAIQISHWSWVKQMGFSPLIIGICMGIVYANTLHSKLPKPWLSGIHFTSRKVLRLAVVLYGFYITIPEIMSIGWAALATAATMMISTLLLAYLGGVYVLGMDKETVILTGAGSSICGAAAILAFEPVVKGKDYQTTVAVATVVLFGTLAMFVYPMVYHLHWLDLSHEGWGVYIGATIHEVAQVVGAASDINQQVSNDAVVVKMTRVILIVPALFVVGWLMRSSRESSQQTPLVIPWFAFGFLGVIALNSLQWISHNGVLLIQHSDQFLLTMAMTALGMETSLDKLKGVGGKPFVLAFFLFLWLMVAGYFVSKMFILGFS